MIEKLVINGDISSKTTLSNCSLSSLPSIRWGPDLDGPPLFTLLVRRGPLGWKVLQDMNGNKAPRPDGFSMGFFQSCRDVIKEDVMKVFLEFHEHGKFEKSLNATSITLTPKIKYVHLISLVSGVYKIIAKILANRLKIVLEIILKTQNAFIKDHQILDSVLITNECLGSPFISGELRVLCKIGPEEGL